MLFTLFVLPQTNICSGVAGDKKSQIRQSQTPSNIDTAQRQKSGADAWFISLPKKGPRLRTVRSLAGKPLFLFPVVKSAGMICQRKNIQGFDVIEVDVSAAPF